MQKVDQGFNKMETDEKILKVTSSFKVPSSLSANDALTKVKNRIDHETLFSDKKELNISKKLIILFSLAASILLILGIWLFLSYGKTTSFYASKGEQREYELPDGSQVSLNAESKIVFHTKLFLKNRILKLDGEAFFNVKKGNIFAIKTRYGKISVLGTSFNVLARKTNFKVSCKSGTVLVKSNHRSQILRSGESTVLIHDNLIKFIDRNIDKNVSWLSGEFNFEYTPLNIIFEEISRQYNVTFIGPQFDKKFFTGSFSNKNLIETLDIVCIPMGLSYEIGSNGKIFIRKK